MNTTESTVHLPTFAGSKSPRTTATDILSVSYCPHHKLLYAQWNHFTTSAELRQSIRLLARAAAILKAELVLVEIPATYYVSEQDQQWAKKFMQDALKYTSIRRVARITPAQMGSTMRQALRSLEKMPYEAEFFDERETALRWLLQEDYDEFSNDELIRIPLHVNVKLIRPERAARGHATVPVAPPQSGEPTNMPAPANALITIETDFMSITLDKVKSLMNIRWKKPPQSRQYRYGMLKAGRALIEHRLERLLLNNQRLGVLTLEDQGWLISISQQMLPKMSLKKLAVITSSDALQQMSSEYIGKRLKHASVNHQAHYFLSEEDAMEWLLVD